MILQTRIKLDSTTRLSKYKYIGTTEIDSNQQPVDADGVDRSDGEAGVD